MDPHDRVLCVLVCFYLFGVGFGVCALLLIVFAHCIVIHMLCLLVMFVTMLSPLLPRSKEFSSHFVNISRLNEFASIIINIYYIFRNGSK